MTIENTLNERGARYGDFTDHAAICEALIRICSGSHDIINSGHPVFVPVTQFAALDPVKKQAIRVICDKLARILSPGGDPEYRDNWHDIQGYAKLAEDRCKDGDAIKQAELPLDPVMPELRSADAYAHTDGSRECRPLCQHGVAVGGYCFECDPMLGQNTPAELDPRDRA